MPRRSCRTGWTTRWVLLMCNDEEEDEFKYKDVDEEDEEEKEGEEKNLVKFNRMLAPR